MKLLTNINAFYLFVTEITYDNEVPKILIWAQVFSMFV